MVRPDLSATPQNRLNHFLQVAPKAAGGKQGLQNCSTGENIVGKAGGRGALVFVQSVHNSCNHVLKPRASASTGRLQHPDMPLVEVL